MCKRIIGSIPDVNNKCINKLITRFKHYKKLAYKIINYDDYKEFVYYYKDNINSKKAFKLYKRYLKDDFSISLRQHIYLGLCFGYDKEDIRYFINDIKDDYSNPFITN